MKDAYYFSHDSNARQDIKIQALRSVYGLKGYGQYWVVIEMMREQKEYVLPFQKFSFLALAREFDCSADEAKKFIEDCIYEFGLFVCNEENFWSDSLVNRMHKYNQKREMQIEKGRRGGLAKRDQQEQPQEQQKQDEQEQGKPVKAKRDTSENATVAHYPQEVTRLTEMLVDLMRKNNPNAKIPDKLDKWNDAIRLMIQNDGYTETQIEQLINYSQSDSFWKGNILSCAKLREKAGTLILQMNRQDDRKPVTKNQRPVINTELNTDSETELSAEDIERIRSEARRVQEMLRSEKVAIE